MKSNKYFPFYPFIYLLSFSPFLIDVIVVRVRIYCGNIMLSVDTQNLCFLPSIEEVLSKKKKKQLKKQWQPLVSTHHFCSFQLFFFYSSSISLPWTKTSISLLLLQLHHLLVNYKHTQNPLNFHRHILQLWQSLHWKHLPLLSTPPIISRYVGNQYFVRGLNSIFIML